MTKPLGFEKPVGVRDYLPESVYKLRVIEQRLSSLFNSWGYEETMTPTLEYYDTVGVASAIADHRLFKLLDTHGRTLVLRPDMTTPIARVVASVMQREVLPLRLSYHANIFRAQENEAGRSAEFFEKGVELIGDASVDGDAEMLALAVASLQVSRVSSFKITVGHEAFLTAFLRERIAESRVRDALKRELHDRDYVGYRQRVATLPVEEETKRELNALLLQRGGEDVLRAQLPHCRSREETSALNHLLALAQALEAYGVTSFITFDLGLLGKMNYYTGICFEGYAEQHGFPLLSGGRYDALLQKFGRPAAAVGFSLKLDRLAELSPVLTSMPRRCLIVYAPEARMTALAAAAARREKEWQVTVQVSTALSPTALKQLRSRYDEVVVVKGEADG